MADGYYAQFCLKHDRFEEVEPTEQVTALDVGLMHFYTDNRGNKVENPRHLRKSEKALKRLQRRVSRKKKGSNKRQKAINKHRIVKKSLSQRTHVCQCGLILDRDENASRNLLAKGLELVSRGGHSRINAQGHLNLCQISERASVDKFGG
jgi:transposase